MSEVLTFTDKAIDHILGQMKVEQGQAFRVSIKKTGCSGFKYEPAIIQEGEAGDLHFVAKDLLKVFVDPNCVEMIKGLTVDLIEEQKEGHLKQKKLVFVNPNEKSRCGCGESFHV